MLVNQVFRDSDPLTEVVESVVENPKFICANPATNVRGILVLRAGQHDVAVRHKITLVVFLHHKASGTTNFHVIVKDFELQRRNRRRVYCDLLLIWNLLGRRRLMNAPPCDDLQ